LEKDKNIRGKDYERNHKWIYVSLFIKEKKYGAMLQSHLGQKERRGYDPIHRSLT